MKVLHVAESALGGVGSYIAELVPLQMRALGRENVRVIVPEDHAAQTLLPDDRLAVYARRGRSPATLMALVRALRVEVERCPPDVIHAHSTFAGLAVRSFYGWRRTRPRIVYCPHGWAFDVSAAGWKRGAAAVMERALAGFCDRIVCVSRHEAAEALRIGIDRTRIAVVLNGIADGAPAEAADWPDPRLKVLFVGRLDRQKGYDTLLDAIAPLHHKVSVRVVGEAVRGASPPSSAGVERLGWLTREAIGRHLAAADLAVIPSRWEGFGLVALEAMRAGKMVIASNVGGLREVVRHDVSGWLVQPDNPSALGRLIARSTPRQRQRMGANGRARFLEHFTAERMHRQLLDVYLRGPTPAKPSQRLRAS